MLDGQGHVYVLALEEGRFYVGHTNDIYRRICQHFCGQGSVYTKTFKALRVVSVQEGGLATEKAVFAQMCAQKGFENCRGAGYTKVQMNSPDWYRQAKDYKAWKMEGEPSATDEADSEGSAHRKNSTSAPERIGETE